MSLAPDHPPAIAFAATRIRVTFGGHEVADSDDVLIVREPGAPPVLFFPRDDVEMTILAQTQRFGASALLGPAAYFTIYRDGHVVENAAWSFDAPPPAFQTIAGRIAFSPIHFEFAAPGQSPADWRPDLAAPAPGA